VLDVEPTDQPGRTTTTGNDRNGNEAVAGAALEAFPGWLHRRYAAVEVPSARPYRSAAEAVETRRVPTGSLSAQPRQSSVNSDSEMSQSIDSTTSGPLFPPDYTKSLRPIKDVHVSYLDVNMNYIKKVFYSSTSPEKLQKLNG